MRPIVFPYKMGSVSAKLLAEALGAIRVYPDKKYKPKDGDILINYGNSKFPTWWNDFYDLDVVSLNYPQYVDSAINKLKAFEKLKGVVNIPNFTKDRNEAIAWLADGKTIIERQILSGHSGAGIVIHTDVPNDHSVLKGPLFTEYVKKKKEYRVHVVGGTVVDVAQKKLRVPPPPIINYKVRNHKGGWIYARQNIDIPAQVLIQAQRAVQAFGLYFGAVDIGWNELKEEATVYEVNCAPGLSGTTLYRYAKRFANGFNLPLKIEQPPAIADDPIEDIPQEYIQYIAPEDTLVEVQNINPLVV